MSAGPLNTDDLAGSERAVRWWKRRSLHAAASAIVVALIFGFLLPQLADYGDAWDTLREMTWIEVVVLTVVAGWNLCSYIPLTVAVLPGIRIREAAVANFASTAISNTLPGGSALGVGVTVTIERSYGLPTPAIALGAVVSGVWNNFAKLALPVVALGLLAITGETSNGLTAAAIVGLAVLVVLLTLFALLLRSAHLAARVGLLTQRAVAVPLRLFHRPEPSGWADAAVRFRAQTIGLVAGRGIKITLATLVNTVSLYLVLLVSIRAVGVSDAELGWITILAAFAFVRLLSAIPITPGGIGVVELGLTASLGAGLPQSVQNQVAAAVLLYRALTWFVPIPLGVAAWLFWRTNTSWRETTTSRAIKYGTWSSADASPDRSGQLSSGNARS